MIQSGKYDLMTDESIVSDRNSRLILKTASRIDKDSFPECDVFSAI